MKIMSNEKTVYLSVTFSPNNVFFNLSQWSENQNREKFPNFLTSIVFHSCGLHKEKGIKRTTMVAFESNFKVFIEKIKTKKIFFNTLFLIFNKTVVKFRRNKFENFFSLKKYLILMLKYLPLESIQLRIINNQNFSFNGCRLPKYQRKKIRRKNLFWVKLKS